MRSRERDGTANQIATGSAECRHGEQHRRNCAGRILQFSRFITSALSDDDFEIKEWTRNVVEPMPANMSALVRAAANVSKI